MTVGGRRGGVEGRRQRIGIGAMLLLATACQDVQPGALRQSSSPETGMGGALPADTAGDGDLEVRLEAVTRSRPEAEVRTRNPFQFGPSAVATEAEVPGLPTAVGDVPAGATRASAPVTPRVRLRMIGLIEGPDEIGRIAVLTDGDTVFHGRDGDIVDGRYRLLVVGPTSVQIESIHDAQRQVLRLAGT